MPVLCGLLDHRVELLLGHLDNGKLTHLGVPNYSTLLQELLLNAREKVLLVVVHCILIASRIHIDE